MPMLCPGFSPPKNATGVPRSKYPPFCSGLFFASFLRCDCPARQPAPGAAIRQPRYGRGGVECIMPIRYYWFFLAGSILFEVAGTSIMKLSQASWPAMGMGVMYLLLGLSYFCLAKAVIRLPLGVAYAFWEGFGLLLITLVSAFLLHERLDATRLLALAMVLGGTLLVHHGTEGGHGDAVPAAHGKATGGAS